MIRLGLLLAVLALAGCLRPEIEVRPLDAGCETYAVARTTMPRPLPDTALARWVDADLDAAMKGTCLGG